MKATKRSNLSPGGGALRLTETGIMLALAVVLGLIKLVTMPYGGSVTPAHMLPLLLIAYRHGTRWGLFAGAAYGLLELLLGGTGDLKYISGAAIAVSILGDYLLAYAAVGFGGMLRRRIHRQWAALSAGAAFACLLRYALHVVSGAIAWWEFNPTALSTWVYSMIYNATYMAPVTLVTVLSAFWIGTLLDFRGETITRLIQTGKPARPAAGVLPVIGKTALATAAIYDIAVLFLHMQDAETGLFSFAAISAAPWPIMGIVTAAGIVALTACLMFSRPGTQKYLPDK
ncbi:MAG: energy-coupled thiamine transporter ThiT [Oscillospiraceae bacterium]|nr:energy-coupled thiamine transporter ThiT [Oscillospiraceae bacterium]